MGRLQKICYQLGLRKGPARKNEGGDMLSGLKV